MVAKEQNLPQFSPGSPYGWAVATGTALFTIAALATSYYIFQGYLFATLESQTRESLSASGERYQPARVDPRLMAALGTTDSRVWLYISDVLETAAQDNIREVATRFDKHHAADFSSVPGFDTFQAAVKGFSAESDSLPDAIKRHEDIAATLKQVTEQRDSNLDELRSLLALSDDTEFNSGPVYQAGILAGLPVIDGLPDPVANDYVILSYLKKNVISKQIAPASTARELLTHIKDIQHRQLELTQNLNKATTAESEAEAALASLKDQKFKSAETMNQAGRVLMLNALTPQLDEKIYRSYRFAAAESTQLLGLELPQLSAKTAVD